MPRRHTRKHGRRQRGGGGEGGPNGGSASAAASAGGNSMKGEIIETPTTHGVRYELRNSLNSNILEKIKPTHSLKTNARIRTPRLVGHLTLNYEGYGDVDELVLKVRNKLGAASLPSPVAYISYVTNIAHISFVEQPNRAASVTEAEKEDIFGNTNIGVLAVPFINPEDESTPIKKYFLRRRTGVQLMKHAIEEARKKSIKTILLQAATPKLIPYYEKIGFAVVEGIEILTGTGLIYGRDMDSGPIMILKL
jgi:hypothetical protein